jgi:hypothetical protein
MAGPGGEVKSREKDAKKAKKKPLHRSGWLAHLLVFRACL